MVGWTRIEVFKAPIDWTRREILQLLGCKVLAAHFDVSKPSMPHHVEVVRDADPATGRHEPPIARCPAV